MTDESLGSVLREAREAMGYSVREAARCLGISASHLSFVELGRKAASEDLLAELADFLELDFHELMARSGRVSSEVEQYLMSHPTAGLLFECIAQKSVDEARLKRLIAQVERLPRKRARKANRSTKRRARA